MCPFVQFTTSITALNWIQSDEFKVRPLFTCLCIQKKGLKEIRQFIRLA